jgi:hypothetical protein
MATSVSPRFRLGTGDPVPRREELTVSDEQQDEQIRQMRRKAEELELQAQHEGDRAKQQRLMEEAVRLRAKCQEVGGPESATMDPM